MQRPTAVTVFGILNIVFGIMGITCTPIGLLMSSVSQGLLEGIPEAQQMENPVQEMMSDPTFTSYTYVSTALGMVVSAALLAAGIGLLKLRPWGRYISIGYAIYSWVSVVVGGIISYYLIYAPMMERMAEEGGPQTAPFMGGMVGGMVGGMIGGFCFGLVYPTILLIFMLLPDVKAAFQPGWGTPPPVPPEAGY
jgi:hypothetical protein